MAIAELTTSVFESAIGEESVGVSHLSETHIFSTDDITGGFDGVTYAVDPSIILLGGSEEFPAITDKDGNILSPIDSEFGFIVEDFFGADEKTQDGVYTEGWAGDILKDTDGDGELELTGLALVNAVTDTFKSGQPFGTWAAGLGGNSVKASTEQYVVMAELLSDQAIAGDAGAEYPLDNDLRISDFVVTGDVTTEGAIHNYYVAEIVDALEAAIAGVGAGNPTDVTGVDLDRDGTADPYRLITETLQIDTDGDGVLEAVNVGAVDFDLDGAADVTDGALNGFGVADIVDLLAPNESTVTNNIAYGDDYSVTLKDDGKLLYRWGTEVKRPNDIRMDVKLDLPDSWLEEGADDLNGGLGYRITRAELVVTHDVTNNPNDQIRPEDFENEAATGRKPSYYIITDPDDAANTLWVSPVDSYAGSGDFLPSYFALTETGAFDMTDNGHPIYHPDDTPGVDDPIGYRNLDETGAPIGTVLRDFSLVDQNAAADLDFTSADLAGGFTDAFYTSTDRDPFEWSYDRFSGDEYKFEFVGFRSREEAEDAGFTEDALVSGPRWRLTANKFGQNIPGVEIPLVENSQPPYQADNIRYETGDQITTTINLLDWADDNNNGVADDSPFLFSTGWTEIDRTRLDVDQDGVIDEGWSMVNGDPGLGAGDDMPDIDTPIISAVTPNGMTLTPDAFDTAVYLKGDRRDSAKIFSTQLILEYEADPGSLTLYDYGDGPDTNAALIYKAVEGLEDARAEILPGFYIGAPDGASADIDAENRKIADIDALGDDRNNTDDEGDGVVFTSALANGATASLSVTASIPDTGVSGFLHAWIDFDGDGVWETDEKIIDGDALVDGEQAVTFTSQTFAGAVLNDGAFYARFILSDLASGVGAYRDPDADDFFGEVEDYRVSYAGGVEEIPVIIDTPTEEGAPDDDHGGGAGTGEPPAPIPPDIDESINICSDYTATHVFSTDDITGRFDGATQGDLAPEDVQIIDFLAAPMLANDGTELYPINSEFAFDVTDFVGAEQRDFFDDPEYVEGWAGDLLDDEGGQLGLVVSNAETQTLQTPALHGTWLVGMGGDAVKASTEHYSVMQNILSDQAFPEDPDAVLQLDDDLVVMGGEFDGRHVAEIITSGDVGDENGDGVIDIRDILAPNEDSVTQDIAVSSDYSVTLKDDGKLLYRWGNEVKRPVDIRIEANIPLPDEWKTPAAETPDLAPLFFVSAAELVVRHETSNNPNDQIRPEDFENEAATGRLPDYEVDELGRWLSIEDYFAGDGAFYPGGTVLRDPAREDEFTDALINITGATSADLEEGFTNEWYTTQNRDPFEPELGCLCGYEVGPRWRLKSNKYGQDLPGVEIPQDPSAPPPPKADEIKYEVGAETQTVINLLDWEGISPFTLSAGWQFDEGEVSENCLNRTADFDVAFYIKGDRKPLELYDARLEMTYEEVAVVSEGVTVLGTEGDDIVAGQGGNSFEGGAGTDIFVLSYGADGPVEIVASTVVDFTPGADVLALIGLGVGVEDLGDRITQVVTAAGLEIRIDGVPLALLEGVSEPLGAGSFYFPDSGAPGDLALSDPTTGGDDTLPGDDDTLPGDDDTLPGGDDTLPGGDDTLPGGDDTLPGGDDTLPGGDDTLPGGDDTLPGGDDTLPGGDDTLPGGDDTLPGGDDTLPGGDDTLPGGDDTLPGGDDTLPGGDDTLPGGDDTLPGGDDAPPMPDMLVFIGTDDADIMSCGSGEAVMRGGAGNDTMRGCDGDDEMYGDSGADVLDARGGDDLMEGGQGRDMMRGRAGDDTLLGQLGADTLLGGVDEDRIIGGSGADSMKGGGGDDLLRGGEGADIARGGAGADRIVGGGGNDLLIGAGGDDHLSGQGGDDRLNGGLGDDSLNGGLGDDILIGDGGSDLFIFELGGGNDRAMDYEDGVDRIGILSGAAGFGDLVFEDSAAGAVLTLGDARMTLVGAGLDDLDATDFLFGADVLL